MAVMPINGLYYPPIGKFTGFLPVGTNAEYARLSDLQFRGSSRGGLGGGEGAGGNAFLATESEPNDTARSANFLPLGTDTGKSASVVVSGTLPIFPGGSSSRDADVFSFDLRAGDIFDAVVDGQPATVNGNILLNQWDLSFGTSTGSELIGSSLLVPEIYPPVSPLSDADPLTGGVQDNRDASLQYVVPTSGRYTIRVAGGVNAYTLSLKVYRPVLENTTIGTKQIVFLDFDGEFINRNVFDPGLDGTARLSPLIDFLPGWGLEDKDESAVIDSIVAKVTENFIGSLQATGGNGLYRVTGRGGDFDLEIRNSRDHEDPWGLPNVSRLIIGGTINELAIPTIGIAQSIDIGNFDTQESAVTLLDLLSNPDPTDPNSINSVPMSGSVTRIQLIGEVVGNITTHEAGHFFGAWHTDNTNLAVQLMDTGGVPLPIFAGAGLDGIYGTSDDIDIDFGTDRYDALGFTGRQNSAGNMAFGLSTGKIGGTIQGSQFNDRNRNGRRDSGEEGLANFTVYVDANQNGALDTGEVSTQTNANGDFNLGVGAGTYRIRVVQPAGWQQTLPTQGFLTATVTNNQTATGLLFGSYQPAAGATGFVWNDANGNGLREAGEAPMAGVWVYIDADGDNRIDLNEISAISKADGSYNLQFPGAGTYTIREVLEPGFIQTYPGVGNGDEHTVTFNGTTAIAGLDFGNQIARDFGDLPANYGVTGTTAASHGYLAGFSLGSNWDAEADGQPSANADSDDLNGIKNSNDVVIDDEDGVVLPRPIVAGRTDNRFQVSVTNNTSVAGYLQAWVDFNGDGDLLDAGEQVAKNLNLATGVHTITFTAPTAAVLGNSYARFRYSDQLDLSPTGSARAGEVEDYIYRVSDRLDLAVDDRYEVARNSIGNSLNVLANDFKVPGETITVVRVGNSVAGGVVTIGSGGQSVTYTPPQGFLGQDSFTYEMRNSAGDRDSATVVVDVKQIFVDPVAVDDSFDVATGSLSNSLTVLANDIEGQAGALSIVAVSPGSNGGTIQIAPGAQAIRYTPASGFGGTEQFTYTVTDANGKKSTATVTVHSLPGDRLNDIANIILKVTDSNGTPISQIMQGQEFEVRVFVDDLRDSSTTNLLAAPGVYAAYLDILYASGLVQPLSAASPNPNGNIDFNVTFQNGYTSGKTGNGLTPGVINDLGALSSQSILNFPDEVEFARLKFKATSAGVAEFVGDPADNAPFTDVLMYDTPLTPLTLQQIRFNRVSLEVIGDSIEFPTAVDDSFTLTVPLNAVDYSLPDVMKNDGKGSTGSIRLSSVTQPANGSVRIFDPGTPSNTADDVLRYTPNFGFSGTEQFTYTITDQRGFSSTARVTLQVGNAAADDQVALNLTVTDLNGTPIDQITVGQTFKLRGSVKDLRGAGVERGIYAAFQDVLFDKGLVSVVSSTTNPLGFQVTFGPNYLNQKVGDIKTPGLINELGSVQTGTTALGENEFTQFEVTVRANSVGLATFISDPADISPIHDTLTYNPVSPVAISKIRFGFDSVEIVASSGGGNGEGFTNGFNRYDVNNDGYVTAIDALGLINELNRNGARGLGGNGGSGEGETGSKFYPDVNADGYISAADVLMVINELNRSSNLGSGEGEGEGEGEAYLTLGLPTTASKLEEAVGSVDTATVELKKAATAVSAPVTSYWQQGMSYDNYLADCAFDAEADGEEEWSDDLISDVAVQWLK
jgi:hypothetical protein